MLFTVNDGIPAPIKYLFGGNERTSQVIWKGKVHRFRFIITAIKGDWPFLRSDLLVGWQTVSTARTSVIGACCQTLGTTYLATYSYQI